MMEERIPARVHLIVKSQFIPVPKTLNAQSPTQNP